MTSRTQISWAELHAPLFLAGTNLGQKLDPKKRGGLAIEYDEERRHLYVGYNGQTARVPETSVLSMVEAGSQKPAPYPVTGALATFNPSAAQVSTPQSHVFAGPGGGVTGQEEQLEKIRQKPGPKPKVRA